MLMAELSQGTSLTEYALWLADVDPPRAAAVLNPAGQEVEGVRAMDGGRYSFTYLPCASVNPTVRWLVVPRGATFDPEKLRREIEAAEERGLEVVDRLLIDPLAQASVSKMAHELGGEMEQFVKDTQALLWQEATAHGTGFVDVQAHGLMRPHLALDGLGVAVQGYESHPIVSAPEIAANPGAGVLHRIWGPTHAVGSGMERYFPQFAEECRLVIERGDWLEERTTLGKRARALWHSPELHDASHALRHTFRAMQFSGGAVFPLVDPRRVEKMVVR